MSQTLDLIHNRRSIRAFQDKPVEPEVKEALFAATLRAPTAGNMMLYSIIEVEDQGIKDKLVKSCDDQPFIARSPLVLLFLADYQRWMDYFVHCDVPGYCEARNMEMRPPAEGDLMLACCDALIAAQNAVIAAEALGLGSCYIGDIIENYEFHRDLFNLPQYTFPITMLCLGYPQPAALERKLTPRFPSEQVCYNNRYRHLSDDEFDTIFADRQPPKYIGGAENVGQHMYARKYSADFSVEMNRSAKAAIKAWVG